ncbi:ATP-grasp fold amidoligase family protein [Alkalicoccus luteus]|uniref:ATP-grasp fold amidoligase family protein n=1 Tax=Alkalicoccus luteus TaxID=1237094 RepID=UPI0040349DDB
MNNLTKNIILAPFNIFYKVNPKKELQLLYRLKTGQKLNLENPITYNEKLNWIKLYDKNPLMPICSDKYTVRDFVASLGCGHILNDLYWEGFEPENIPFEDLPNQFVIKVTHGSGLNIICKNKQELNCKDTINRLKKWLKVKYLPSYGEWFYNVVKPRIIIEKFLSDNNSVPVDYKVFCFNGVPKFIDVHTSRFSDHKRNLYDLNWKLMKGISIGYKNDESEYVEKPKQLQEMLDYAKILSSKFHHARVDFYISNKKIYFGEITFTNGAGFSKITPYEFNKKMGSWITLPISRV